MNKGLISIALATLVVMSSLGVQASAAGKKKRVERTETLQYIGFSGFRGAVEGTCDSAPVACVIFAVEKGDRFVSIDVVDTAGMPVWAAVYVYGYVDGHNIHEHVCGSSERPFEIAKGIDQLVVTMTQTTAGATSPCMGPATVGNVTATFSNIP